ncbi:MAG: tyrosine--tRNA ligase [Methanocalculaceae archaeon]|jgi:tyrosyl-tRNA synthetase|nr:tyrosine--tRNA ligase [Methanocalculaceae archaeon]
MDAYELVTRNTAEIVTEDELRQLLNKQTRRVYAGYEPSGEIHLGHLVIINKLMDMKAAGFDVVVLIANLHAYLNRKGTFEQIKELAEYNRACIEACNLKGAEFVLGTDIQLTPKYQTEVLTLCQGITINRAIRSMDEIGRAMNNPMVSQMIYPVMQVVDIPALNLDAAIGGIDQRKIHMLAREHLPSLGYKPPVCIHMPIVNGLDGQKMSSSKGNIVSVADSPEDIKKKIKKAFCPPEVEGNPILQVFQYIIFPHVPEIIIHRPEKFGGNAEYRKYAELEAAYAAGKIHPMDLKTVCGDTLAELLADAYGCVQSYKN